MKILNNNLIKPLVFLLILTFFFHFIFVSFLYSQLGSDNAYWHYLGWSWYNFHNIQEINLIENKPPGMMFMYYLSSKFYDVNFLPLKIVFILIKIITGYLIYKISGLILNDKDIQIYSLLIYFLLLGWKEFDSYNPVYSEVITTFISTLCLYIFLKARETKTFIFLGFLFSLGFMFKQTSLIFFIGFLFLIYFQSEVSKFKNIFLTISSFLVSFLFLIVFFIFLGLNFEGIFYQITNVLSAGTDTLDQISSRIKHFLLRWTGPERVFLFFSLIYVFYFYFINPENKLAKSFCIILILVGGGAHAVGTITGHQLIESIPIFIILFLIFLDQIFRNNNSLKNNFFLLPIILILFFPNINLMEYKYNFHNFSIQDKKDHEVEKIKNYVDKFFTNPNDTIYIHERDTKLLLQLKKRSAADHINTTFLYQSYGTGQPNLKEIQNVKEQLVLSKPKMIIMLRSYEIEAPYIDKINFFDEILQNYSLDNTISKYNFYLLK